MAEQEAQALIDNPTKTNAATCEMITDLAQCELQRLIKEMKTKQR